MTPEYINRNWTEELLALMMMAKYNNLRRLAPKKDQPDTLPVTEMPGIDFEEVHVRAN